MCLTHGHVQSMEFVEQARMRGWRVGCERLPSEANQRLITPAVVPDRLRDEPVPLGDPAKILVRHWNRVAKAVEQNGVGGLGTNARQRQQPFT